MKARLLGLWSELIESFWLVPAVMALAAILVAGGAVALDRLFDDTLSGNQWIWSGGADGARSLLSTIASSMITVAGTVFSITIAALTLASQQFGPRLLRNFTADRGNQIVLGTFVATFLYCLMVLRTVRSHDEGHFVPNIAVSFGVVLACASLGVLIYYIHHIASNIQAESLIAGVGRELSADFERLAPDLPSGAQWAPIADLPPAMGRMSIESSESGYIQLIDREGLFALAQQHDVFVEMQHRPGDFVSAGESLLTVSWQRSSPPEDIGESTRGAVHFGPRRTPLQDIRYGIRQLTEIGARALSPGINDPFTATGCVDWMTGALAQIADRESPTGLWRGEDGASRLLEEPVTFANLLRLSLQPIRAYGASSAIVVLHMLDALARLVPRVSRPGHRRAILEEAQLTLQAAQAGLKTEQDLADARHAFDRVRAALGAPMPSDLGEILPGTGVPG